MIAPTEEIPETIVKRTLYGIEIEFFPANDTEAPAEMLLYFPELKLLNVAETAVHTIHNVLPPRGAKVRNTSN